MSTQTPQRVARILEEQGRGLYVQSRPVTVHDLRLALGRGHIEDATEMYVELYHRTSRKYGGHN